MPRGELRVDAEALVRRLDVHAEDLRRTDFDEENEAAALIHEAPAAIRSLAHDTKPAAEEGRNADAS